jgi:hypothetical protein
VNIDGLAAALREVVPYYIRRDVRHDMPDHNTWDEMARDLRDALADCAETASTLPARTDRLTNL